MGEPEQTLPVNSEGNTGQSQTPPQPENAALGINNLNSSSRTDFIPYKGNFDQANIEQKVDKLFGRNEAIKGANINFIELATGLKTEAEKLNAAADMLNSEAGRKAVTTIIEHMMKTQSPALGMPEYTAKQAEQMQQVVTPKVDNPFTLPPTPQQPNTQPTA